MIRIGIIGCGHWGSNHIRIFNTAENVSIITCCDKDPARLNTISRLYPSISTTTDYRKVIDDKNLDAVIIATPTASHYQLVKLALMSGKHVLSEKPLTVKKKESLELVSLAQKLNRILMVGYVFLFNNGIIALRDYVRKKELGKVRYLHFARTNLGPIRDDVDVIYDLASHDISIASFLLNSWPEKVSATAGYFLRKHIADTAFITLYYPQNIIANIHVSWLDPRKIRRITCIGDKKMAVWNDLNISEPIRIFNKGVTKEPFYSDYGEFQLLPVEGEVVSPRIKLIEPLKNQNLHFLESITRKKRPFTDAQFGHQVTNILETIQLSIARGSAVQKIL
jgi:predicted dehydrogenase